MKLKKIAVIPARGGSKRIPDKNIISFFDKPMIAWTIEAALRSKIFDRILVSTDDKKIAEIAEQFGASAPFLRKDKYDDSSPVSEATITALQQSEDYFNEQYETVVQLMPNCPLRTSKKIVAAYKNYQIKENIFQISCFKFLWMNPWWSVKLTDEGVPESIFPEALKKRSQDLPDLFCPTGAIWIANVNAIKKSGSFYGRNHRYYPLDWRSAIDIDTYDDLELAKALFYLSEQSSYIERGSYNES